MTDIDALYGKLKRDAERRGYRLNPDEAFVKALIEGLLANGARYGYESCPCRLAAGKRPRYGHYLSLRLPGFGHR